MTNYPISFSVRRNLTAGDSAAGLVLEFAPPAACPKTVDALESTRNHQGAKTQNFDFAAGGKMSVGGADSLLQLFVRADGAADSDGHLSVLLSDHAEPIVTKIIRYKTRGGGADAEDIYGEVMVQLVGRLQRLRQSNDGQAIEDFNSYVAVTTYNACDRYLSRKYPNRRRLKNGLRYLLTHRAGFNCWQDARSGNYVGGFARWQFGDSQNQNGNSGVKISRLREDARAFARDVNVQPSWSDQKNAYELLTALFEWANQPIEIDLITSVAAEWWNVTDETIELDGNFAERAEEKSAAPVQLADARPDAAIEIERRAYLQKLWNEINELPPRQRAAVLLNLRDEAGRGIVDLWLVVGVATIDKIAAALEMSGESFAELWSSLPLDDNQIAARLGLTRQQVINLRKSARERLARRMKGF